MAPELIKLLPVSRAKMNPEQAAARSNPHAFIRPALWQTRLDVDGKIISGVTVAQITSSISSGLCTCFFQQSFNRFCSHIGSCECRIFKYSLSLIPIRCIIHSSVVSTICLILHLLVCNQGPKPVLLL
jgi:hypothetical protein